MSTTAPFNWRSLLTELFGVVFAVLLALWVDEWRENRETQQLADSQKQRIIEEVRGNMKEVFDANADNVGIYKANYAIITQADWWKHREQVDKLKWSILSADLKDSAWTITLVSRAAQRLDATFLSDASNVYKRQALYEQYLNGVVSHIDDQAIEADRDPQTAIKRHAARGIILSDLSHQMLQEDASFLKKYDAARPPPVDPAKSVSPGQ